MNYKIYNLSISSQNLISSILSTYDELIKNNEKRIKILEEMAQRMYAEWFVIFKFPGYEKVKMVDTPLGKIPEGWRVEKYEDVFDVKYGKNLPTSKLENMGFPVYGAGGIIGYYSEKNVTNKTPLVTCRGNGSGTVWRTFGEGFVTNNSFYILGKNPDMRFEFIFNCLKNSNIMSAVSGSAQPQITIDSINYVKTVFPGIELIQKYQELASPLYLEADLLRAMNDNLGRMRDLLIPQLVTGRREVKHDK